MKLITRSLMLSVELRLWAACAAFMLAGTTSAFSMTLDRIAAKVGGEIITLSTVLERSQAELARKVRSGDKDIPPPEEFMPKILDKIIDEKLQTQEAKKIGISVNEESIQAALDEIKENNNITEEELEEMLKNENSSLERYKETIRDQILVTRVMNYEVLNRVSVSDRDIKKYYRVNQKQFWTPGKVHALHILFILDDKLTREERRIKEVKAKNVLGKIRNGAEFEKMAKLFSEDLSGASGGDLGILEKGKMVAEFEEAVFALKDGEVSDLVKTPYGLHIIKAQKVYHGNTIPFDDVKNKIERVLRAEKGREGYKKWIEELRKNAYVEKMMFKIDPAKEKAKSKKTKKKRKKRASKVKVEGENNANSKSLSNDSQSDKRKKYLKAKKRLAYYKKLRDTNKISEEQYLKKKRQLLKRLKQSSR